MTKTRSTCTLTGAGEPPGQSYAQVTIIDSQGDSGRACPRHAVAALDGITCARVDGPDSQGLNQRGAHGPGAGRRAKPARLARRPGDRHHAHEPITSGPAPGPDTVKARLTPKRPRRQR